MELIALPSSPAVGRKLAWWIIAPAAAIVAMGLFWVFTAKHSTGTGLAPSMVYRVRPVDLDIKIVKDGELQAINNLDISCEVEGQATILTLVPEGSIVKKGDILMTLDASVIKQKIEDTTLELQKAEADLTTARELKDIQDSQNSANLEAAEVAVKLAQLDIKQYNEGTYPQQLTNAETDLKMAQITLKNTEEKFGQTKALFAKGFVTATAVKDDELQVTTARNTVAKAMTALSVIREYTHQMDQASKQSAASQAEQKLIRTKRENASALAQRVADVQAKEQALSVMKRRMERYQQQLAACTIKAPADGLVVYSSTGDRGSDRPIQEGQTVRERQSMLRLPDTSSMKAVIRIQEAQVSRLRVGQRARVKIVGMPNAVGATLTKISVLSDSGQRWWNPDLKEYPVDLTLDETPTSIKPGMGVNAEVFIDRVQNIIAVPLATLYSAGPDVYVFVHDGEQFVPRKVKIGRTNETHAEILNDVVQNGEQVLLLQVGQGQELLDKAGIKVAPTTLPRDAEDKGPRRNGPPGNGAAPVLAPGGEQPAPAAGEGSQQPPRQRRGPRRNGADAPGGAGAATEGQTSTPAPTPAPTPSP